MMLEDDAGLFDELHSDVLARAILSPRRLAHAYSSRKIKRKIRVRETLSF